MNKIERKLLLKKITNNLGKVEETENEIICYVRKNKCKKDGYSITIPCHGQREKYKEQIEKYNLNKQIVYVIEDIKVKDKRVYVFGYNKPKVIIKNCAFLFDIYGRIDGTCEIDSNYIRALNSSFIFSANELTVKNTSLFNPFSSSMKLDIALEGEEKLKIINSTIGRQNQATNVSLIAKEEIEIENSSIQGDTISTKSNKITCDNKTNFISKKQILDSENYNNLDITTNELIIDGNQFNTNSKQLTLKSIKTEEEKQKYNLLKILNIIKEQCIQKQNEILQEHKKQLQREKIYTLKK